MRYYCSVCNETITKGEFQYSMDKFGKALCRTHQSYEQENENNIKIVIDTKYKKDPSNADFYQILAYSIAHQVNGILLYPRYNVEKKQSKQGTRCLLRSIRKKVRYQRPS